MLTEEAHQQCFVGDLASPPHQRTASDEENKVDAPLMWRALGVSDRKPFSATSISITAFTSIATGLTFSSNAANYYTSPGKGVSAKTKLEDDHLLAGRDISSPPQVVGTNHTKQSPLSPPVKRALADITSKKFKPGPSLAAA